MSAELFFLYKTTCFDLLVGRLLSQSVRRPEDDRLKGRNMQPCIIKIVVLIILINVLVKFWCFSSYHARAPRVPLICPTCPTHLISFKQVTLILFDEQQKLCGFPFHNFEQFVLFQFLPLGSKIFSFATSFLKNFSTHESNSLILALANDLFRQTKTGLYLQ